MTDVRQRAKSLIAQEHISTDVVQIIEALLEITVDFERQLASAEGQSGDLRVLKSRLENLSNDVRKKELALQEFKKNIVDILSAEIRNISTEVGKIAGGAQSDPDDATNQSAKSITQSLRKIVELIAKA